MASLADFTHRTDGMRSTRQRAGLAVVALSILAIATMARIDRPSLQRPFGTDEADYLRALSYGLVANYSGAKERSGAAFVREVVAEYRATGWARPFNRDWRNADAAGLRHYHPPLGLYAAAIMAGAGLRDEQTLRLVPVALGVLTCLAAALLAGAVTEGRARVVAALVAGLLVATSPYHIAASNELAFHAAFGLLSTLSLVCLAMTTHTGGTRWWQAAAVAFGLTILTVPYWALLLPPFIWTAWRVRRRGINFYRMVLAGLAVIAATVLIAWPPFLAHAGFVKPALMYGGILLKPLPGSATSGGWLAGLAVTHWLTLVCLAIGVGAWLLKLWRVPAALMPAVLYCAGFVLVNIRVMHMKPLYAADLIAPLSAVAAVSIVALGPVLLAAVAVAALAVSAAAVASTYSHRSPAPWKTEMTALTAMLGGDRVLVTPRPAGAMIAYYSPNARVVLDSGDPADIPALRAAAARGEIDVVVQWGSRFEPGGVARNLVSSPPHASFTIDHTRVHLTRLRPSATGP